MPLSYEWQRRLERWKQALRGLAGFGGGGDTPRRPRLCPACGTLVGIHATRCHVCGTSLRFSLAALSKNFSGIFGEYDAPVTMLLLVSNILMLGVSWMALLTRGKGGGTAILWGLGIDPQYQFGMSVPLPVLIETGEWWRLITAQFLHAGLLHIGFNMMALMQIGPAVEEIYGSARYLFLYLVTGAFGYVLSSFSIHFSLGASAGLLGLVGLLLAVTSKRGGAYMRQVRSSLINSVVILFAIGLMPGFGIDNWAHGGGLVAGFVLGRLFVDRQPQTPGERKVAYALGWLAGLAILVSFAFMILHYRDPNPFLRPLEQ